MRALIVDKDFTFASGKVMIQSILQGLWPGGAGADARRLLPLCGAGV